jgi:hypothetical protein
MSQSETETRPSLGTIIEALHDSEINGSVSWFFDNVWSVALGNPHKGIDAEATVSSPQEAAEWLRANAARLHPDSKFAKRFHRTGK